MDFYSPHNSLYSVPKELRALEPLENALVRVQVPLRSDFGLLWLT